MRRLRSLALVPAKRIIIVVALQAAFRVHVVKDGFHLGEMRRDLFYSKATIRYKLGASTIAVEME